MAAFGRWQLLSKRQLLHMAERSHPACNQPSCMQHDAPEGREGADDSEGLSGVHHLHLAAFVRAQQLQHLASRHHQLVHLGRREVAVDGALQSHNKRRGSEAGCSEQLPLPPPPPLLHRCRGAPAAVLPTIWTPFPALLAALLPAQRPAGADRLAMLPPSP